jgi:hypothetical protein
MTVPGIFSLDFWNISNSAVMKNPPAINDLPQSNLICGMLPTVTLPGNRMRL